MHIRISFIAGLIILSAQSLFSQTDFYPSFIVNHRNDTVYGMGNVNPSQEFCLFKTKDAPDYTKYNADEVVAFKIIDGKYYVSREVKDPEGILKWYLLEFLVDGEIDLFAISNYGRYFIKKENADFLELNDKIESIKNIDGKDYMVQDKRYIGFLRSYMSETPELFPEIDKIGKLNQRNLIKISINYHNAVCNEYECINYVKKRPYLTYRLELLSGLTRHNDYYAPQIGFLWHVKIPVKKRNVFLKTGILFSDKPYWKKDSLNGYGKDYGIRIPISFQYVFGRKDFKPTIEIGWPTGMFLISSIQGGFIYSISEKMELSLSGSIDGPLVLCGKGHKDFFNNPLGHTINMGLIYNIN